MQDLILFVICYIYNDEKSNSPAEARVLKWKLQKNRKNLLRIPPDVESMRLQIERANYLSFIEKHFELKVQPSPLNHGWHLVNGRCLPLKPVSPPLPQVVVFQYASDRDDDDGDDDDDDDDYDDESSESGSVCWSDSDSEIGN